MKMVVRSTCPTCGKPLSAEVNQCDYEKWEQGALVQDAFPYLTDAEREMFITGICLDCWNEMFIEDDDYEQKNWDDVDWEEDDWEEDYDDCDYEMGFDPYMGCFTDDC